MVSILINIIQHEQYLFYFRHMFLLFACSFQSHATCWSFVSYYRVNNKCNRIKWPRWRWLIYALRNFSLHNKILSVFRSNHHCSGKFHTFHRQTPVLESLFFLKRHLFCMSKPYFCRNFLLIDWRHKHLKNTIDLLLF